MTKVNFSLAGPVADAPWLDAFESARVAMRALLPPPESFSTEQSRRVIQTYCAGVAGHFVTWLAAGTLCCRSFEARYATAENAFIEIRDDHPGMLREFARLSGAEPTAEAYRYAALQADLVQTQVSKMSGLFIVALVGTLENISLDYIPWLSAISKGLGNGDMRYVDIHGEADIAHAQQFQWALEKEAVLYDSPGDLVAAGANAAVAFIGALLQADR